MDKTKEPTGICQQEMITSATIFRIYRQGEQLQNV